MDIEFIIGFDALYESAMKCKNGVMWKDSVASFILNCPEEVLKLETQLKDGTYKSRDPVKFEIMSPKRREISSISFRDRVFQRSLNDNALYPIMTRSFIYDNWACQKGKGTDGARDRLKKFMRQHHRKHGTDGYVAQFDIHGYYPNMDHDYVENMFRQKLPEEIFKMVQDILHHQYEGDKGYNPGSQMIQIAGISALNDLDHYIKEVLRIKHYIRYMDDFILIHPDREYLEECRVKIIQKLEACKFTVNEKKTRIYPIKDGIEFLGFKFTLTDTGKVLMLLADGKAKAKRKTLARMVTKSKRGEIPRESVDQSYNAWRAHASKGDTHNLLMRMDKYYRDLWRDDNAENQAPGNSAGDGGDHKPADERPRR